MDDSMSVDLRKLKKPAPTPVVHVVAPPPPPPPPPPVSPEASRGGALPVAMQTPAQRPSPMGSPAARTPLPTRPARSMDVSWKWYAIGGGIVAVLLLIGGYYIYSTYGSRSPFGKTPENTPAQQAAAATSQPELTEAQIINNVSTLMAVPEGESPALAKVSDLSALKGQVFFANAKVGDIVLMYQKAARAILYDPIANKIIEVGPIQNSTSTTQI